MIKMSRVLISRYKCLDTGNSLARRIRQIELDNPSGVLGGYKGSGTMERYVYNKTWEVPSYRQLSRGLVRGGFSKNGNLEEGYTD